MAKGKTRKHGSDASPRQDRSISALCHKMFSMDARPFASENVITMTGVGNMLGLFGTARRPLYSIYNAAIGAGLLKPVGDTGHIQWQLDLMDTSIVDVHECWYHLEIKPKRGSAESDAGVKNIARRLIALRLARNTVHTVDDLSVVLGVERRRVYEVVKILSSMGIWRRRKKSRAQYSPRKRALKLEPAPIPQYKLDMQAKGGMETRAKRRRREGLQAVIDAQIEIQETAPMVPARKALKFQDDSVVRLDIPQGLFDDIVVPLLPPPVPVTFDASIFDSLKLPPALMI